METMEEICGPSRELAQSVLKSKIKRHEKKCDALKIMLRVIPWESLTKDEEEILWNYFCGVN